MKGPDSLLEFTAGERLRVGDAVILRPRDGKVYRAEQADGRYDFVATMGVEEGGIIRVPLRRVEERDGRRLWDYDEGLAQNRVACWRLDDEDLAALDAIHAPRSAWGMMEWLARANIPVELRWDQDERVWDCRIENTSVSSDDARSAIGHMVLHGLWYAREYPGSRGSHAEWFRKLMGEERFTS